MIYIAIVEIIVYPYMSDSYVVTKNHTVEADSEDEAKKKIDLYYSSKDEGHGGTNYGVNTFTFFEHIS